MLKAILVVRSRSFMAPVDMSPINSSSAARPPSSEHISSSMARLVCMTRSSGRYQAAPRARPRGTMVTLTRGLANSVNHEMVACPASWMAIDFFSASVITFVFFSSPPMMRSTASRKSCLPTFSLLWRAAMSAASLQTLAMSAPENPGVWRARKSMSRFSSSFRGFRCTTNISLRSFRSGSSTCIWRSKRPARISAESSMSARLVAASVMMPLLVPNPSISVSRAFSVFSRSSLPPMAGFLLRARPTASISSMKMMQGAFCLAFSNRSRTREAPTPTNISTKSEPDIEKKGTPASPATALASSVLPVPGGPTSRAPLGILPPSSVYFCGFFRKSTISCISCLAPACPATSLKVMPKSPPFSYICALDLPTLKMPAPPMPAPPPPMRRMMNIHTKMMPAKNSTFISSELKNSLSLELSYENLPVNFCSCRAWLTNCSTWPTSPMATVTVGLLPVCCTPWWNTSRMCSGLTYISSEFECLFTTILSA